MIITIPSFSTTIHQGAALYQKHTNQPQKKDIYNHKESRCQISQTENQVGGIETKQ